MGRATIRNVPYSVYCKEWQDTHDGEPQLMCNDIMCEPREPDHGEPVWGCDPLHLSLNAQGILEDALMEHHEDAVHHVDEKTLQELLDGWLKDNSVTSYSQDMRLQVWNDEEAGELVDALESALRDLCASERTSSAGMGRVK